MSRVCHEYISILDESTFRASYVFIKSISQYIPEYLCVYDPNYKSEVHANYVHCNASKFYIF